MNPSAPPADSDSNSGEVVDRYINDALVEPDPETVEQLIARVLRRAHLTADAPNALNEARAILHLAHLFADELATANARFDRLRFVRDATEQPS